MSRHSEVEVSTKNPAKYFLEYKSNEKAFVFYNKETSQNVLLKPPYKFLFLKQLHTVKGFSEKHNSGIYANEVEDITKEPLTVKTFKGGFSVTGLYNEIKPQFQAIKGEYNRSIYCLTEKGVLINLSLKGTAVFAFGDFIQKQMSRLPNEWIVFKGTTDGKKGAVSYTVPEFEFGNKVTPEQAAAADAAYDSLIEYIKGHKNQNTPIEEVSERVASTQESQPAPLMNEPPQSTFTEEEEDDQDQLPF